MRTSVYFYFLTYISGHYLSSAIKLERPSASLLLQKTVSHSLIYLESPHHDDTCLCGDRGGVNIRQMANFDNTYGGKRSEIELDMADTVSRITPSYFAEQPNFYADVSEMIRLVTTFALPNDHISCRLALINGIRCPKWHEDNVNLRLIKTYYGVGTDWVDPSDVGVRMNNYFRSLMDWDLEVKDKKKIKSARVDDILLISGKASPDSRIVPVLHRSPLVPESDRRLLLTVTIS